MLKLTDFDYILPPERIAKYPLEPRDSSKLLVVSKTTGELVDSVFSNLTDFLLPGDVLVRNNTKVIPARVYGKKTTGGLVELLLTKKLSQTAETEIWDCLTKPGLKMGQEVALTATLSAQCVGTSSDGYTRHMQFSKAGPDLIAELHTIGITPLPPYISDAHTDSPNAFEDRYQTTYAKHDGSAAAPTAGLHFTKELDEKLQKMGVIIVELTLHVGLGTFLPVKISDITQHHMHSEWFELSELAAKTITETKANGNRIVAVGTTSARVLESCTKRADDGTATVTAKTGETDIYIYPPYQCTCVDVLITNFHLPQSTLLMLVSAFCSQPNTEHLFSTFGESIIGLAYTHAIQNEYRFYSFGDGMLIL